MAEAIGLGASILGIAAFGATVVTTLRKFGGSYTRADEKLAILSADVSLTASILTELGNTIKEYEKDLHLTAHNFVRVKAACERDFERLHKGLRQAKKEEDGVQATSSAKSIGKRRVIEGLSPWEKLKFALGGEDELEKLIRSLETSKANLQLLLDSVNLMILKKLNQKHLLNEDQSADLRELIQHIPILVKVLQGAEFIPWSSKPNTTVVKAASSEGFQSPAAVGVSWVGFKDPNLGSNALPALSTPDSTTNPPNVTANPATAGENDSEDLVVQDVDAEGKRNLIDERPEDRIQTATNVSETNPPFPPPPPPPPMMTASSTVENTIIREPSGSRDEAKTQAPEHVRLSTVPKEKETEKTKAPSTRSSLDLETRYEGWLLEKNNDASIQPEFALSIGGFKLLKLYNIRNHVRYYSSNESDDESDRLYTIKPYSTDQTALKEHIQAFRGETAKVDRQARISLILKSFEKYAQNEIKRLIKSRNKSSPKGYEWLVVAVIPLEKLRTRWLLSSIRSDRRLKQQSRLLLVLKGGSATNGKSTQKHNESSSLPARHGNAWQQIFELGVVFSPDTGHRSEPLNHHFRGIIPEGNPSIKIVEGDSVPLPAPPPLEGSLLPRDRSHSLQYVAGEGSASGLAHGKRQPIEIDSRVIEVSRGAESQFSSVTGGSSYGRFGPPIRRTRYREDTYNLRTDSSDGRPDLRVERDAPTRFRKPRDIMRERELREAEAEMQSRKVSPQIPADKKNMEEREKEYKLRLEDDLRKSGMNAEEIDLVLKNDKLRGTENRPTYTRMSRRHLSLETLNEFRIDYQLDSDPDYILIKRWVPEFEQDLLWAHTRRIRERRHPIDFSIEDEKSQHLRKEAGGKAAKEREERMHALEKAKKEKEMAIKEGNEEAIREAEELIEEEHQKLSIWDNKKVEVKEAVSDESKKEAEERAEQAREQKMKDAIEAQRMGLTVKDFNLKRERGELLNQAGLAGTDAVLTEPFREEWKSEGERAPRVDEELELELELERARRRRLERFGLQNEPIFTRSAIPPPALPGTYSAAGSETLWYDRGMPSTDEDDDLLPRADAERLMDEFLATFTDGGDDGQAAADNAGEFTLADNRRTEL